MASLGPKKRTRKQRQNREERLWNPSNPTTPLAKARAVIGSLVKTLQEDDFKKQVGIEATEVFKGGSMGHGTTVPGKFDIDLVLYSRSITVQEALSEDGYEDYLDNMDKYLQEKLGVTYTHEDVTNVAIKFSIQRPGEGSIDIDLILSPYFSDHDDLLRTLTTVKPPIMRVKMFSVSASKFQTDFIRHQHIWIKEFIRRAKAWKNINWAVSQDGKPKSYLMSILVIIAFDKMPEDMKIVHRGGMRKLDPLMTKALQDVVNEIESNDDLDLSVPGSDLSLQSTYSMLLPSCPRIIDPANPANNLYLSGIMRSKEDNQWTPLKEKIKKLDLTSSIMTKHKRVLGG